MDFYGWIWRDAGVQPVVRVSKQSFAAGGLLPHQKKLFDWLVGHRPAARAHLGLGCQHRGNPAGRAQLVQNYKENTKASTSGLVVLAMLSSILSIQTALY